MTTGRYGQDEARGQAEWSGRDKSAHGKTKTSSNATVVQEAVNASHWVLDPAHLRDKAAQQAHDAMLRALSADNLLAVEQRVRRNWHFSARSHPVSIENLHKQTDSIVNLQSWNPNGRMRQRSIELLGAREDTTELPFLIMRIADWVEPVRTLSIAAVRARMTTKYALDFAMLLGLLSRQRYRQPSGATEHLCLIEEVLSFLGRDENRDVLRVAIRSSDKATRQECLPLILAHPENAHFLLAQKDVAIRSRTAEQLATSDAMSGFVKELLRDKQSSIRATALEWFRVHRRTEAPSALQAALLDKAQSMRDYARYWVRTMDPTFDVREFYLEQLQSGHKTALAISGLGETGTRDDVVQLLLPLESSSPRVVAAAIVAIGNLDGAKYMDTLWPFTLSWSASIRKAACEALVAHASSLNVAELCMAFTNHDPSVQRNLLRLIKALPKWDRLGSALYAFDHAADARVRDHAGDIVRTWVVRNHTEWAYNLPSPQQWARIMLGWKEAKGKLPDSVEGMLDEILSELQRLLAARNG